MKRYFDNFLFSIDFRDFYQIKFLTQGGRISESWYCGNKNCGCGDYNYIQEQLKQGEQIIKVPLYKKINFYRYDSYWIIIGFILGIILGIII